MSVIYPEEFAEFFKAMSAKMQIASVEKGDSWKTERIVSSYRSLPKPMDDYLTERLKEELQEYEESGDPKELIDIANFCAMLWCRKNTVASK